MGEEKIAAAELVATGVDSVWPDVKWPRTFFASVRLEEVDS